MSGDTWTPHVAIHPLHPHRIMTGDNLDPTQ